MPIPPHPVIETLECRRLLSAGHLDASFGSGGRVLFTAPPVPVITAASASALRDDGKLIEAGVAFTAHESDLVLARFNADGSPDSSFGTGGTAWMPLDESADGIDPQFGKVTRVPAIALDGHDILVGAYRRGEGYFRVTRFTGRGALDRSFGADGTAWALLDHATAQLDALRVGADGSITAAGSWYAGKSYGATGGVALAHFSAGGHALGEPRRVATSFLPTVVSFAPGGKVLATGPVSFDYVDNAGYAVTRLTAASRLDPTFARRAVLPAQFAATSLLAGPDGSVYVGGASRDPVQGNIGAVARFTRGGTLDRRFGRRGVVSLGIPGAFLDYLQFAAAQLSCVTHMALGPGGALLAAGAADRPGTPVPSDYDGGSNLLLARVTPAGKLDPSFGTRGEVQVNVGTFTSAVGLFVRPGGAILTPALASQTGSDGTTFARVVGGTLTAVQFTAGGAPDPAYRYPDAAGYNETRPALPAPAAPTDLAVAPDGRVLLATRTANALVTDRLQIFDGRGRLRATALPSAGGAGAADDVGFAHLAVRPDGSVLAAGTLNGQLVVRQFNADGSPDLSFAADTHAFPESDFILGLFAQGDGGAVAAVLQWRPSQPNTAAVFHLLRFDAAGHLVADVTGPFASEAAAGPGGTILVAALSLPNGPLTVTRYRPDFTPDPTFGSGGTATVPILPNVNTVGMVVKADGKVVVAADRLIQLNADGSLDTAFGNGGPVPLPLLAVYHAQLLAQADGSVLACVFGSNTPDDDRTYLPALARYTPAGRLDPTFGKRGKVRLHFDFGGIREEIDTPLAALTPDGGLLLAGIPVVAHPRSGQIVFEKYGLG